MLKRKVLFAALVASTLGAMPIAASADRLVVVDSAPPAPRHEAMPEHRHGYVWAPGYWDRRHGEWIWVKGHWEREHHGMYWHPNRWEQREGRWELHRGEWRSERYAENHEERERDYDRDRDHDHDRR